MPARMTSGKTWPNMVRRQLPHNLNGVDSEGAPNDADGLAKADPGGNGAAERLTCIHQRIHWPDTNDPAEATDELDRLQVDNFIKTLAEVAQAVARRNLDRESDGAQIAL